MNMFSISRFVLFSMAAVVSVGARANSYTLVDLGQYIYPTGVDGKGEISATLESGRGRHRREIALMYSGGKWRQLAPRHEAVTTAGVGKGRVAGNTSNGAAIWVHHG